MSSYLFMVLDDIQGFLVISQFTNITHTLPSLVREKETLELASTWLQASVSVDTREGSLASSVEDSPSPSCPYVPLPSVYTSPEYMKEEGGNSYGNWW